MSAHASRESGQAVVETALTLPLTLFFVLGMLQLFLLLHARLLAEHAAWAATRTGALSQGSCQRMKHAAILVLLPSFDRTDGPNRLAAAFRARNDNFYKPAWDMGHDGRIVWLQREVEGNPVYGPDGEDPSFDDVDRNRPLRLTTTLTFWYPMRIPFVNWVMARLSLAAWGIADYTAQNPLVMAQQASWVKDPALKGVTAAVANELRLRTGAPAGTFVFPIQATASFKMMTAPRNRNGFLTPGTEPCQ